KLPKDMQLIIARNILEDDWNLDEITKAVAEELTARERTARNASSSLNASKPQKI
uniref:Uncharacterized protein n=1 Tax=Amphimedon queenslandica TaxID=400682 RepID=A0A1X7TU73_AMPQE